MKNAADAWSIVHLLLSAGVARFSTRTRDSLDVWYLWFVVFFLYRAAWVRFPQSSKLICLYMAVCELQQLLKQLGGMERKIQNEIIVALCFALV